MGFKKSFLKSILTYGSYTYATQILEFFSTIIVSRYIFPEEYGFVAIIRIFTEFIAIFSQAGFSHSIIRSDYRETFWKVVSNLTVWLGIFFCALLVILSYPIALFFGQMSLILPLSIAGLQFITVNMNIVPFAILSKRMDFNSVGKIRLISATFRSGLMIGMAVAGFSYWSLILPYILSSVLEQIILRRKLKFGFYFGSLGLALFGFRKIKSLIQNVSAFNLVNFWTRNLDNLLIGKFYGNYDLGIYNRAYRFLNLVRKLITSIFGVVLYPSMKKLKSEGADYRSEYCDILRMISLVNFIPGFILLLIPNELVFYLWGDKWLDVAQYLPYFGIIILLQPLLSTISELFILEHREKDLFIIGSVSSAVQMIAIVVGAFFSVMLIVQLYVIVFLLIIVPTSTGFGYIRSLKFKTSQVLILWGPRLLFGILLFINVYLELDLAYSIMYAYIAFLLIENGQHIKKIGQLIYGKLHR